MADTYSVHGWTYTIRSWDGGRLNTKAHGPGTLVDTNDATYQCTLNHGVISGYCWRTRTDGFKGAEVYNTQGMYHGTQVTFFTDGDILLRVYNNGKQEGDWVQGMMCIQYI
jgi:hypothetical protein